MTSVPAPSGDGSAPARRQVPVPDRYELRSTLAPLGLGGWDRCVRFEEPSTCWRATRTPEGSATGRYQHLPAERVVSVEAWGPGAAWLVEHAPDVLGGHDDVDGFAERAGADPVVAQFHRLRTGMRIGRSLAVFEALVPTICAQKVTGLEAKRAWTGIVDRWGEPAPGPSGLRLPPAPETLAGIGYHELHRLGIERRRAEVIRAAARHATRLETLVDASADAADAGLRAVEGIGVWSAAEVRRIALGDADAVSYGDYHLPHMVAWNLLGQRRGSDELMAELLAPFAPHQGRVVRLIELCGRPVPRRGPRLAPNGMRSR